LIRYAGIK